MVDKIFVNQLEAAAMLGVSPSTVRNMVKDGRLKPRKIYKRALYESAAVRRLLQGDDADATATPTPESSSVAAYPKAWRAEAPPADPAPNPPEPKRGILSRFTGTAHD
jgi:Helix-turn-helix domain